MAKAKKSDSTRKRLKKGSGRGEAKDLRSVSKKSKATFKKAVKSGYKKKATDGKSVKRGKKKLEGSGGEVVKKTHQLVEARVVGGGHRKRGLDKSSSDRISKKARLIRRKAGKGDGRGYELVRESKLIWEHLRQHDNIPSRTLALDEMMALAKGHFRELALKHDTARVVQSCLKFGSASHRSSILAELKDSLVDLSKLKYANFVVKSLLRYSSPAGRGEVIGLLYGKVRCLVRHSEASEVVELAYNEYANLEQRTCLVMEFYGSEFAVFKDDILAGHAPSSSGPVNQDVLGEVLSQHPDKAGHILSHMRDFLLPLLDKNVVRHSIVHRALLDYIKHCSTQARSELIECVRDRLLHVLHTKDGSRFTMHCLWHGSAKDRKVMVKSLKGLVGKVCSEEHGHLVLLALLDCVDDTVLVKKAILSELVTHLHEISSSHYGRRVLLYLLVPRSSRHFSSQFVQVLAVGDSNTHSKKPAEVRRQELLESVAPALVTLATEQLEEWLQSKTHSPLFLEVMLCSHGDQLSLYQRMMTVLCDEGGVALLSDVHTDWVMGRLLVRDNRKEGFLYRLLSSASEACIKSWVQGSYRAAYLLSRVLDGVEKEWVCLRVKISSSLLPISQELAGSEEKAHQTLALKISEQ